MKIQLKLGETSGRVMLHCTECDSVFPGTAAVMLDDKTLSCPECGSLKVERAGRAVSTEQLTDCAANAVTTALKDTVGYTLSDAELKEITESVYTTVGAELDRLIKDRINRMQLPKSEMSKTRYLEIYDSWKDIKKTTGGEPFFYDHADVKVLINMVEELLAELHPKFMIDDPISRMPSETFRSIWYTYLRLKHKLSSNCTDEERHLQVSYNHLFELFEETLLELSRYKEKGY